jgi:hypothetical protein
VGPFFRSTSGGWGPRASCARASFMLTLGRSRGQQPVYRIGWKEEALRAWSAKRLDRAAPT